MKQSFTKQRIARVVMTLLVMMLTSVEAWATVVNKKLEDPVRRNDKEYTEGMYWVSLPYSNDYDKYVTTLTEDDINNKCKGKFKVYDSKKYLQEYDHGCHGNLVIEAPEGYVLQLSGSISTGDQNDYLIVNDGPEYVYNKMINELWGNETITPVTTSGNTMRIYFHSDDSGQDGTGLNLTVTILKSIELVDKTDTESSTANSTAIDNNDEKLVGKVTLSGRTLSKGNGYNTLTLPFAMTAEQIAASPLAGAKILALDATTSNLTGGTLTLNFEDATSIEAGTPYLVGWNTSGPDLVIESASEWETFANNVNNGTESYDGKLVKLNADISTSTMVGSMTANNGQGNPFKGIFDGGGHTINVDITETSDLGTAPFSYIYGATITNVKVTGTVKGTNYCAGLVGFAKGNNVINNCEMAANVTCTNTHCGGILGHGLTSNTTITDCLVLGSVMAESSVTSNRRVGIIFGWGDSGEHKVVNCVSGGSYPTNGPVMLNYGLGNSSTPTVCDNCYRTTSTGWASGQTTDAHTWIAEELLSKLGTGWKIDGGKVVPAMNVVISNDAIVDPVFRNVTIDKELHPVSFTGGTFEGNYAPFTIDDSNIDEIAYIGSDNTIGYAAAARTLRPFRAHFNLPITSGSRAVTRTIVNFGDGENGETTGIIMLPAEKSNAVGSEGWYTIDGRRLSGKPTAKGLYINNGRKVVIK